MNIFVKRHGWGIAASILAAMIYGMTLAPGVYGYDSAELATGAYTLSIIHPPGYPLYLLIGNLFTRLPIGNVAFRLNIMSAFFAALTVFCLFSFLMRLGIRKWVAFLGSLFFAFSLSFWQMAVVAEVYTLHTLIMMAFLLFLLQWDRTGEGAYLLLAGLTFGLGMANHTTVLFMIPGAAIWVIFSPRLSGRVWLTLTGAGVLALMGLLLYGYFPIRDAAEPAINYVSQYYQVDVSTLKGVWWMMSGQAYRFYAFGYDLSDIPGQILQAMGLLSRNFLGIGLVVGLAGIYHLWRRKARWTFALLTIFLLNMIFYINYRVLDKDTMFLPAFLVWAIFIVAGVDWIRLRMAMYVRGFPSRNSILIVYRLMIVLLVLFGLAFNWQWSDFSHASGPEQYARLSMEYFPQDAVVLADWSPAVVLEYLQVVEGQRPDIQIYNRSRHSVARYYEYWKADMPVEQALEQVRLDELADIQSMISSNPVYMVGFDRELNQDFGFQPIGNVFRLEQRTNGSGDVDIIGAGE